MRRFLAKRFWMMAACFLLVSGPGMPDNAPEILDDAKKLAEIYMEQLKSGEYAQAYDSVSTTNKEADVRDLNLIATEIFYEEFGKIQNYEFDGHRQVDASHIVLLYQVTYETMVMKKEIQVLRDKNGLTLVRATDDTSGPEALKKMIRVMKKISENVSSRQET